MNLQQHIIHEFSCKAAQEEYIKKFREGLWPAEEAAIAKYVEKGKILDLGCGTGRTTKPLQDKGYDVIGVDITPAMISSAKKLSPKVKFEVGDATKLRFKDNAFDCILFSNQGWSQIPGTEKRKQALREMRRVLKKEGILIITTHVRKLKGFILLWIKQWLKQFILKPIGFNILEEEFGDVFFERENSGMEYETKQTEYVMIMKN